MTLILELFERTSVVHASDRRVTVAGRPHDETANKSIIFQARDARVVLGYTGAAYVGESPTDEWIAYQLAQTDLPPEPRMGGLHQFETARWPDLGAAAHALAQSLSVASTRGVLPRGAEPAISLSGWHQTRRRRRLRRVRMAVYFVRKLGHYVCLEHSPQRDNRERGLSAMPKGWLTDTDARDLEQRLAGARTVEVAEDTLAAYIREKSEVHPEIGANCLTVRLDILNPQMVKVRFIEDPRRPAAGVSTPVLVWPGLIATPLNIWGTTSINVGNVVVEFTAPTVSGDVAGDHPVFRLASVPRVRRPR